MTATPRDVFRSLTASIAAMLSGKDVTVDDICAHYADDVHLAFPFDPQSADLRGREAVASHFAQLRTRLHGSVTSVEVRGVAILDTVDPEVIVAEFAYHARTPDGGFDLPNIFVLRVRGGLVVSSRDYSIALA
jgi:uncharacterized protein